jgi:hypothetical protein
MTNSNSNQKCLPGDTADSGMDTMSTDTHSQETRDSFQTVNEQISGDTLLPAWKCHPKGVCEALSTDVKPGSNEEAARKRTAKIISRWASPDLHSPLYFLKLLQ